MEEIQAGTFSAAGLARLAIRADADEDAQRVEDACLAEDTAELLEADIRFQRAQLRLSEAALATRPVSGAWEKCKQREWELFAAGRGSGDAAFDSIEQEAERVNDKRREFRDEREQRRGDLHVLFVGEHAWCDI